MPAEPVSGPPAAACLTLAVQQGRRYLLCVCGRSRKKPLCDGSHAGSGHLPDFYTAGESTTIEVCYCGKSAAAPLCDRACRTP